MVVFEFKNAIKMEYDPTVQTLTTSLWVPGRGYHAIHRQGYQGDGITNVTLFGADPTGALDSTAAINQALASSRVVYFPAGTYTISGELTIFSNTQMIGENMADTIIHQTSTSALHLTGTDLSDVVLRDLTFLGPGNNQPGGGGIYFKRVNNANTPYIRMRDILVDECANTGISISTPIVSSFNGVVVKRGVGNGIALYSGGTSCALTNCYVSDVTQSGFFLQNMYYSVLTGCAADTCGIDFDIETSMGIHLNGCGSEQAHNFSTSYNGIGFKIYGGDANVLNACYAVDDAYASLVLDGASPSGTAVVQGFRQRQGGSTPVSTYAIVTTANAPTTTLEATTDQPNSITQGRTRWINQANGTLAAFTPVSGTAYQNANATYLYVMVQCYATTAGTAGTVNLGTGPSSTNTGIGAAQYVSGSTSASAPQVLHIIVPPGWWWTATASAVTLTTTQQILL